MAVCEPFHFFLVSHDPDKYQVLKEIMPEAEWSVFERGSGAIEHIFNDPPELLLVDNELPDFGGRELIRILKSENVYRQVPVVLCISTQGLAEGIDFSLTEADDFLLSPLDPVVTKARLDLVLARSARALDANPLTKLPGNTSIIHKIQDLIDKKEDFALAYADLDHFKSFNDKYGFSRGDEVLMMTSRVIVNTIRAFGGVDSFVGHIGGDDFVFIVPVDLAEQVSQMLIKSFDGIVPNFYDREDREQEQIVSVDRKGNTQTFPLMAISVAVVFNQSGVLTHYGEASQRAMNLKKVAKKDPRSSYVLDRRITA
ncbi:MAG: diguanylate cyclase domain-containing protein [Desulfonatronovibrionaceae bacterium]